MAYIDAYANPISRLFFSIMPLSSLAVSILFDLGEFGSSLAPTS